MPNKPEFKNKTIAPLWKSQFGGFYTYVKDEEYDALQGIEKGSLLQIREVKPESRKKETSPHAYLEYTLPGDLKPRTTGRQRADKPAAQADEDI